MTVSKLNLITSVRPELAALRMNIVASAVAWHTLRELARHDETHLDALVDALQALSDSVAAYRKALEATHG